MPELHEPLHMKIGDSAATARTQCGLSLADRCWTQNPHEVTCPGCIRTGDVPYVEVDQEYAYGRWWRMQRSIRVF